MCVSGLRLKTIPHVIYGRKLSQYYPPKDAVFQIFEYLTISRSLTDRPTDRPTDPVGSEVNYFFHVPRGNMIVMIRSLTNSQFLLRSGVNLYIVDIAWDNEQKKACSR